MGIFKIYINVKRTFVTNCDYVTSKIKPFIDTLVQHPPKGDNLLHKPSNLNFDSFIQTLVDSPIWKYGSSVAIVIETIEDIPIESQNVQSTLSVKYSIGKLVLF